MDRIRRSDLLTQLTGLIELHAGRHCEDEDTLIRDVCDDGIWATLGTFRSLLRSPDPARRGILFVPGLFGSHLENPGRCPRRQWLSALSLMQGNLAERLSLPASAEPGATFADAAIQIYGRAIAWWSLAGLDVHTFPYDWRLSMDATATQFVEGLEQLARQNPQQKLVLVTHSMGGLIASLAYPQLSTTAREMLAEAALVGPPLGGSFDVVTAMSGQHLLVALLAAVTPKDGRDDYRAMARTLPGFLQLLPDHQVFADPGDGPIEQLYLQQTWEPGFAPLRQDWLDRARTLKTEVNQSPLLDKAHILASSKYWTLTSFQQNGQGYPVAGPTCGHGDGMVPLRSAARDGRNTYVIGGQHALLFDQREVIQAVGRLAHGEPVGLPIRPGGAKSFAPKWMAYREQLQLAEHLHAHARSKLLTPTNLRWLLDARAQPVEE